MAVSDQILRHGLASGVAGLIATLPMSAAMKKMKELLPWWQRAPLPPYRVTRQLEKAIGIEDKINDTQHQTATAVAHFGYGAAAAVPFAALAYRLPLPTTMSGILYGLLVWAGSYLGWLPIVGVMEPATKHPWQRNALMIVAHLVWGSTLGLIYGALRDRQSTARR